MPSNIDWVYLRHSLVPIRITLAIAIILAVILWRLWLLVFAYSDELQPSEPQLPMWFHHLGMAIRALTVTGFAYGIWLIHQDVRDSRKTMIDTRNNSCEVLFCSGQFSLSDSRQWALTRYRVFSS